MSEAFLKIVNMSISASWLVLAVLALRLILKKAPKWFNVLLWGIVAIRLICPFSIESALSLIPSAETISPEILTDATPTVTTGIASLNSVVNPIISESFAPATGASANPLQVWIPIFSVIWAVGFAAMLLYTAVSYWRLRKKVSTAVILRDNFFQSEYAGSPFVLGIIKPRIYLPYNMDKQNMEHVIAHEQAHIRRKDHWWKPLGFLLLTIHWFNPLMWVAYIVLCRDIELACDEKVIAELGNEQRADYTQALVACAVNRRMIAACPLAFGEVGVKDRVKSIMNYRKPTFWIILTALVVCVVLAVCFLTNPKEIKTPMHILDSLSADDVQWVQITIWEEESVHIQLTDEQIHELMGILKKLDDRDFVRAKAIERDVSLMIYFDETELLLHWDGEFTAFNFDSTTSEEIDDEYCYVNSDELNLYLSNFYPIRSRMSTPAVKWFDYTSDPSGMSYDEELKIQLDEFPDITFKYTSYDIVATTSWEDSDLVGRTILISGLPIWNAYFCDLTGDGLPEICSQVSYGSGMIDNRVIIFDYANGISYKLEDRGYHDYYLRINDSDGYLYVDKRVYNSNELVSSGRLVYKDGCIQLEGVDNFPIEEEKAEAEITMFPTSADLRGLHAGALFVPINGSTYRYDLSEADPDNVTADELLDTFTEDTGFEKIAWEVYSVKEYPDKSAVLMISGNHTTWLCRYMAARRCSDDALQQAIDAGYAVMEDGTATHGQDTWQKFYETTQKGEPAFITVASYHTLDPEHCSDEFYEAFQEDYPCLYLDELHYDGNGYTLYLEDGVRTYECLMSYTDQSLNKVRYVLTHDDSITWEQLLHGMYSSQMGAYIDHYSIYTERKQ